MAIRRAPVVVPYEDYEQERLAAWIDGRTLNGRSLLWHHVEPGKWRNKGQAGKLKRAGVKPNYPDNTIFDPPPLMPGRVGTVVELKRIKGGTVRPGQKVWLAELEARGWHAFVAKGWRAAAAALEELGY